MQARGTVACPTMGAGARVEYEGGINILEMQPNPGAITKKERSRTAGSCARRA